MLGCSGWTNVVLAVLTGYLPGPAWLIAWLHRLRGVKVLDIRSVFIAGGVLIDSRFPEVVTRDVPDHTFVAGNPAKPIKIVAEIGR